MRLLASLLWDVPVAIFQRLRRPTRRVRIVLKLIAPLIVLYISDVLIHQYSHSIARPSHNLDEPFSTQCQDPVAAAASMPRENAVFTMLTRNEDVKEAQETVKNIEHQFNRWFKYPYLFLNDEEWDPEFIRILNKTAKGRATFEVIPKADWTFPPSVDPEEAREWISWQEKQGVYKAGIESYHHMCRFFSGKFYNLEPLRPYKWYWRLEPGVKYTCAITYDPFAEMARNGKTYGFTTALWEVSETCPGLFRAVDDFRVRKGLPSSTAWKAMVSASWLPWPFRWLMSWLRAEHRDMNGDKWNLCHYWSNFEIADLDFFRSPSYQELFQHLEYQGGFYRERWGDAPVHSLAVHLLLPPERIHHFADFGYYHKPWFQCPGNAPDGQLPDNAALGRGKWSPEIPGSIGCRCQCKGERRRNIQDVCLNKLRMPSEPRSRIIR